MPSLRRLWTVFQHAAYEWSEDKASRMAAAVAFYAVFSLTPIVVLAYKIGGQVFGREATLREILGQAKLLIGDKGSSGIELLIDNAPEPGGSLLSTAIGLGVMIFAATGVFTELKDSLNTIWEVQPKPGISLLVLARDRVFGFAMVLVIWFLMLISLVISAMLAGLTRFEWLAGMIQFTETWVSLLLTTLLFALIYRILPDARVAWRDVWLGAGVAAVLFAVGKLVFGLYLGHSEIGSNYGAASSLVIVILWTYFTCLILLFGAEISQVHARLRQARVVPSETGVRVTEHERVQQGVPHAPRDGEPTESPVTPTAS